MSDSILLSIKPRFVKQIFEGVKTYELRRSLPKKEFNKVYVYSSSPTKKVVGYFTVKNIIRGMDKNLFWKRSTNDCMLKFTGVTKQEYNNYFEGKEKMNAIHIDKLVLFDKPKDIKDFGVNCVPQNFLYLPKQ